MDNSQLSTRADKADILRKGALAAAFSVVCGLAQADPLSSNNGFYPDNSYEGKFIAANLDYPDAPKGPRFPAGGPAGAALTVETAEEYMIALKDFIGPSFSLIINDPGNWDPAKAGWYDLVWSGNSNQDPKDPTSGREALMNTYTGQIIHRTSFAAGHRPSSEFVQNHAVIYYDEQSAVMLGEVWKDLYDADISKLSFPEGSIVIKTEATTP